ncbi:serine hydroxymethyltransferase [Candidatus Uhrbacteria bacterium]|nr:serine hydroxymethyltransferase [Candidatus Uhrbacteria bacterium]
MSYLASTDPEVANLLQQELERQQSGLELIPSENIVSEAVLEALGSIGTNKYSEGYPCKRYYGGNAIIDKIESLAITRAKQLFGCDHVNIQPYSGSPANQAVYFALLNPGEKVLGMSLPFGGHLTHGWKVNFSAKYYVSVQYPTGKDGYLDYDDIARIAKEEQPKMIICGATAYPRVIDFQKFREIADSIGAYLVADIAHIAGLVASGVHPSPIPFADVVTTTLHKTLRGPRGAMIMCKAELAEKIDKAVFPGLQGGPHNHVTAAAATTFLEAMQPSFKEYAAQIVKNAQSLALELLAHDFTLVTGGTDNHLLLIDLTNKGIPGKVGEAVLDEVGLTVNKNMVPFDPRSAFDPSGIRLGTPSMTTRGLKEEEMKIVGQVIARAIAHHDNDEVKKECRQHILDLCKRFPIYTTLSYNK